ncbi:BTB/POZ domain-containing protein [Acrasis kona]|uniref:BTB/POZ domain-containing protein n=1 Tax=Acrasis kona TaxID=1008807 RepID=A0AAW2YTW0_9EUKA
MDKGSPDELTVISDPVVVTENNTQEEQTNEAQELFDDNASTDSAYDDQRADEKPTPEQSPEDERKKREEEKKRKKKEEEEAAKKPFGLGADFEPLLNDVETSDITLFIQDENDEKFSVNAHSLILSTRSHVIKKMIQENGGSKELFVPQIKSRRVLEQLVRFLYTDKVSDGLEDIFIDLIKTATTFEAVHLKVACGAFSSDKLTEDNWLEFYQFAKENNEKDLAENSLQFIASNFETGLLEHQQYRDLPFNVICDLLERDDLGCEETALFNMILNWQEHKQASDEEIQKAVDLIRLPIVSARDLKKTFKDHKLINKDRYVEAMEYHVMPEFFDSQLIQNEKRFHFRRAMLKFVWVTQRGNFNNYKISQDGNTIEKTGANNWDLMGISSKPLESGIQYFQVKIDQLNTDRSGMAIGLTYDPNMGSSSYSSCMSVSMEYGAYNLVAVPGKPAHNYQVGDVFGFVVDFISDEVRVYENGKLAYTSTGHHCKKLWAIVCLYYKDDRVSLCNDYPLNKLSNEV